MLAYAIAMGLAYFLYKEIMKTTKIGALESRTMTLTDGTEGVLAGSVK